MDTAKANKQKVHHPNGFQWFLSNLYDGYRLKGAGVILIRYVVNQFLFMLLSLFLLISATFILMNAIPGSPLQSAKATNEQIRKNLEAYYGLDKPLMVQYFTYYRIRTLRLIRG